MVISLWQQIVISACTGDTGTGIAGSCTTTLAVHSVLFFGFLVPVQVVLILMTPSLNIGQFSRGNRCSYNNFLQANLKNGYQCHPSSLVCPAVCTDVISNQDQNPPVLFFGSIGYLYVQMYSHPPPNHDHIELNLHVGEEPMRPLTDSINFEIVTLDSTPLLTFVYTFDIPDVNSTTSGQLEFVVHYSTLCPGVGTLGFTAHNIPVVGSSSK